jgi:hypothetical protein
MTPSPARSGHPDDDLWRTTIPTALEEIEAQGNLLHFAPERTDRLTLIRILADRKLVAWDRSLARYQLTTLGQDALATYLDRVAAGRAHAARG